MKHSTYFWLVGFLVTLASLLSLYHYQSNSIAVRKQAELCFAQILTRELQQQVARLNLPHYALQANSDTIPLLVRITTVEGVETHRVDAEKSQKNISHNSMERSLHSIIWEESPLSLDTLNQRWTEALHAQRIFARTMIQVSWSRLHSNTLTLKSVCDENRVAFLPPFVSYMGKLCEIEAAGFLEYSCWAVCLYHWYPFLWILVGTVFLLLLFRLFYRLTHRSAKKEAIVAEEVIREVIKEVSIPVFVKELDLSNLEQMYELRPDLLFDACKQLLVLNDSGKKLAPQSCTILKLFLDAQDYTLTDAVILKNVWGENEEKTIKDFTVACSRLSKTLKMVDFSIHFKRVGYDSYRMVFD